MIMVGKYLTLKNSSHNFFGMNSILHSTCHAWFIFVFVMKIIVSQGMDYSELEFLGVACPPKDTCNRAITIPFPNRTCECDNQCRNYSDCCIDVRVAGRRNLQSTQMYECLNVEPEQDIGVYVVSACHRNWNEDEEIRTKCEEEENEDMSNPLASVPVTDVRRAVTYKNHYCAYCNNVDPRNFQPWKIDIECDIIPDNTSIPLVDDSYIEDHLTYIAQNKSWGFFYKSNLQRSEESKFYPCQILFKLPNSLNDRVRYCRPYVLSFCDASWRRETVRRKCSAYMAIVYADGEIYKNPHCAICNFKDSRRFSCPIPGRTVAGKGKKSAVSLTLLMDVNMSDGNIVGEVTDNRCPDNQKWDPFAKRCRSSACPIPGYRMENGICVYP